MRHSLAAFARIYCYLLPVLLGIAVPQAACSQDVAADLRRNIDKILTYDVDLDSELTPGCIIGIIETDTTYILEYGKSADKKANISKTEYYDLGGLSKTFISLAVSCLQHDDLVDFSDKITDVFPELTNHNFTINQLLKHESGMPKVLRGLQNATLNETVEESDFLDALQNTPLADNRLFMYSHHNYTLLSLWMKRKFDKEPFEILQEHYPSIDWSIFHVDQEKKVDSAQGVNKFGEIDPVLFYGAAEYSRGIQAEMEALMGVVRDIWLSEDEIVQTVLADKTETDIRKKLLFSRGFYVVSSNKNYTIYTHAGHSNRHSSAIHFVPETNTGIVIFSNSEIGTKDLSLLVLRMINYNWKRKADGQEE